MGIWLDRVSALAQALHGSVPEVRRALHSATYTGTGVVTEIIGRASSRKGGRRLDYAKVVVRPDRGNEDDAMWVNLRDPDQLLLLEAAKAIGVGAKVEYTKRTEAEWDWTAGEPVVGEIGAIVCRPRLARISAVGVPAAPEAPKEPIDDVCPDRSARFDSPAPTTTGELIRLGVETLGLSRTEVVRQLRACRPKTPAEVAQLWERLTA
jgi:hypothetical protein